MPGRIKDSEYKSHYKWLESFRSKGFKPEAEQMAPPAGKGSIFSLGGGVLFNMRVKSDEFPGTRQQKRIF